MKTTKRGFNEDDYKFFAPDKVKILNKAQEEVQYLLDRDYKIMERVVSGDSVILDNCKSWFNLSRKIVEEKINEPWIIKF